MIKIHVSMVSPAAAAILMAAAVFFSGAYAKQSIDWDRKLAGGHHELSIGNYSKAADMFANYVNKHPESGACRTALGMAFKKQGKMGEAKSEFRRATEVEPDYADAYYELGAMLESDKDYKEAEKSFEKYLQLAPLSSKKMTVEDRIRFCRQNI